MADNIRIKLSGLTCASCVGRAQKAVETVPNVQSVAVNLATETLTFQGDPSSVSKVIDRLAAAGYPAVQSTIRLQVDGMTCASCVGRVEKALLAQPGVIAATANLGTQIATVTILEGAATAAALANAVTAAGYETKLPDDSANQVDRKAAEEKSLASATLLAAALTLPVFLLEMLSHFVPGLKAIIAQYLSTNMNWTIQFVLITLVMAGPGRRFYVKGIPALLRGAPEMNSLVALGTMAAWIYSTLALFVPTIFPQGTRAVYFEAAGVIVTLILLGRWLEARAKGRTGAAIQRLVGLQPVSAIVTRDGEDREIPLVEVVIGDVVHLRPGARVAVDGEVLAGDTFIDESMISGEPVPVSKTIGADVIGGTVNGTGALTYRATAVGSETVLSQIIQMVENAQGAKLPIQSLVDRITAVFVPIVMILALATVLVWLVVGPSPALGLALVSGVSVLIIACPCAMGLATPTSIMVGTGRAAELGVLFRKGDALQGMQETKVIALDKTGTLTAGAPELTTFNVADGYDREVILPIIASVEARSEHPIAGAIVRAAAGYDLPDVTQFDAVTGMGARGVVGGKTVVIGAGRFMAQENIAFEHLIADGDALAAVGATPLYAAIDGVIVALIGVSDPIKASTPHAITALHNLGLQVAMITGDNKTTAAAIAQKLNIEHVVAEVMPGEKVAALETLRARYGAIAFVGDGINDAPALAAADTGIAIGTGTDIAIEAADVVLMSGHLDGVVNALSISKATMRNIRQNLFWAFAYNAALLPVAAGVLCPFTGTLLSPMLAAGAMAISSVFVVTNALRLRSIPSAMIDGDAHEAVGTIQPLGVVT
jgi:Cu+-exporting ATPase